MVSSDKKDGISSMFESASRWKYLSGKLGPCWHRHCAGVYGENRNSTRGRPSEVRGASQLAANPSLQKVLSR